MPHLRRAIEVLRARQINGVFTEGEWLWGSVADAVFIRSHETHVAFAASRLIKGAAKKNRCKRILREFYQSRKECFRNKSTVLIARPGLLSLKHDEYFRELEELGEKIQNHRFSMDR